MGEQKNSSAIFCRYSPSIFSLVKNKPYDIEYGDRVFKNFKLEELTYPLKESFEKATAIFPEHEQIQKAIDTCRELGIKKNPNSPFLLISGDLSGIQDTVFTISSKGALKSLRARSFMLEFLCEHICYEIITDVLKDYKQNRNHVIFNGGGSFCLLLPNVKESIDAIEKVKNAINKWAFEEFGGKLYVAIVYIELNEDDVKLDDTNIQFRKKWGELSDKLEFDKKNKFSWKLNDIFSKAKEPTLRNNTQECQICQRDDVDYAKEPMRNLKGERLDSLLKIENAENDLENPIMHELCYQLYKLGDELSEKFYISRNESKPKESCYLYFPSLNGKDKIDNNVYKIYYKLEKSKSDKCLWGINKFENNIIPFYYANYVTKFENLTSEVQEIERNENPDVNKGDTASFNALANMSCGSALIGCLRMDVDNLGKIFAEFPEFNLVTLSNLSKMLNLFFKVFLAKICEGNLGKDETSKDIIPHDLTGKEYKKNGGRNVTIIYSGGDDLFIVGAWDEVTELAYDIQKCFYKFSGLGISAGMTLHKPDFPLYQMARLSGEALIQAKTFKLKSEPEPSKNKFSLFYSGSFKRISNQLNEQAKITGIPDKFIYAVSWDNEITDLVKDLIGLCNRTNGKIELKHISHGFLNRLFNVIEVWWTKDTLYIPELYYIMKKIYKGSEDETAFNKLKNIQDRLIKAPFQKMDHNAIKSLKIPLTWFELLLRSKGD